MQRKLCSAVDCDRPFKAKDLCHMHHQRYLRHGDPNKVAFIRDTGAYKHPLYRTYNNMKTRCCNSKSTNYQLYGARGIKGGR